MSGQQPGYRYRMRDSTKLNGRDRLLNAAEALFAQRGYMGASVRDISSAAGVKLGLSTYHFGNKDALFRSVMERRAGDLCSGLLAALNEAIAAADGRPSLEAILEAYVAPHVDRLASGDIGWRHYMKLGGHTAILEQRADLTEPLRTCYAPVAARYTKALRDALPTRDPRQIETDFHIFRLTVATIAGQGGWQRDMPDQPPPSPAEIQSALTRLFACGFAEQR